MRQLLRIAFILPLVLGYFSVAEAQLKAPFNRHLTQYYGKPLVGTFACPALVAPVVDMGGMNSIYRSDDPTQSIVDPAKQAKEAARNAAFGAFQNALASVSDKYVTTKPANANIANCYARHLIHWAKAGAMLKNLANNVELGRHQAVMQQAWNLSAIAQSYMKVQPAMAAADSAAVRAWIKSLSDSVLKEYTTANSWNTAHNRSHNHAQWAAMALAGSGVLLNDVNKFNQAWSLLGASLATVQSNGTLPHEMSRGAKSLLYHEFACLSLAGLVAFMDANGRVLSPAQESAFQRVIKMTVEQAQNPSWIASVVKIAQTSYQPSSSNFAFIDIAIPHFQRTNPALAAQLEAAGAKYRAFRHPHLGGNITAVYNVPAFSKMK